MSKNKVIINKITISVEHFMSLYNASKEHTKLLIENAELKRQAMALADKILSIDMDDLSTIVIKARFYDELIERTKVTPKPINDEDRRWRETANFAPFLHVKHVFHSGCLECKTPVKDGIGKCRGCQYFNSDWNKPDLSTKK